MPKNSYTIPAPVNGLEVAVPGSLIDTRSTPNCKNVEINRYLIRKKRGGAALGASLGERVLGFGGFQENAVNYLVRVGPTKVEALDAAGTAWASIANAPLTGGDDSTVDFAFPLLAGTKIMVFTNYLNAIRKWTGTGNDADLGGTPPKAKYMLNFRGYLLLANVDDGSPNKFRYRVQWSDSGDPEQWDETVPGSNAGAEDLLEDDLEITGLHPFGDYVAVHKTNSIYLGYLTGTDDIFRFDQKETTAGAVSHNTILNLPTGHQIFLSLQGLRLFNGITAPLIENSINIEIVESMNPSFAYRSWGIIVKELNEAWFGIPIGSNENPDTIYKYNYLTGQLYKDELSDVTAVSLFMKASDEAWDTDTDSWDSDVTRWDSLESLALNPRVIWGFESGVTVERTDSPDFAGAAIDSLWDSKDFTAADFEIDDPEGIFMEWQGVEIVAKGTSISLYYSTDEGVNWTFVKTFALDDEFPADTAALIANFRKVSTKLRIRLANNSAGDTFMIKQFRLKAVPREERRQ